MRLAIGNVANTGCYTIVQLNAERLSTFLCMIQLHFMLHFRHGISEIQIVRHPPGSSHTVQTVFQFIAYRPDTAVSAPAT